MDGLSDLSKIVAYLHHDESVIRRNLLISNVNGSMKETLLTTSIYNFLFGKDLQEVVKTTKLIQSTGRDLKRVPASSDRRQ